MTMSTFGRALQQARAQESVYGALQQGYQAMKRTEFSDKGGYKRALDKAGAAAQASKTPAAKALLRAVDKAYVALGSGNSSSIITKHGAVQSAAERFDREQG